MRVRLASHQDIPELGSMVEQYWTLESISGFDRAHIEALLGNVLAQPDRAACWVANRAAACRAICWRLAAELRRRGTGSRLLAHAERDFAARGLVRVQLQLAKTNERARGFYARHGFRARDGYELLDKPIGALSRLVTTII